MQDGRLSYPKSLGGCSYASAETRALSILPPTKFQKILSAEHVCVCGEDSHLHVCALLPMIVVQIQDTGFFLTLIFWRKGPCHLSHPAIFIMITILYLSQLIHRRRSGDHRKTSHKERLESLQIFGFVLLSKQEFNSELQCSSFADYVCKGGSRDSC